MSAACFADDPAEALPVFVVGAGEWREWLEAQTPEHRRWLESTNASGKAQSVSLLPASDGTLEAAVLVVGDGATCWDAAALQGKLPAGAWRLADPRARLDPGDAAFGWALGAYRFDRYKSTNKPTPTLYLDETPAVARARALAGAVTVGRDLVNTPANDMGPDELDAALCELAERHGASCTRIVGEQLLEANYPMIHAVGRGSDRRPRLVDVRWGREDAPRLTLVGKGVCFDTGGLDIKPANAMLTMKKDMGGAALTAALAHAVMSLGLDVRLRLLVPIVENSISGSAFRPGDVIPTRKGTNVEIGNTDAEGRLILADALTEADGETPALMIDAATLTGAARVALGPSVPAMFTPDDGLAEDVARACAQTDELIWRLPLYAPYRKMLESTVADINNTGQKPLAGAITAALFLQHFVEKTSAWAHLDVFAWNDETKPGRPRGGEVTALRSLVALIERRFAEPSGQRASGR